MRTEVFTCDQCKATIGTKDKRYHLEIKPESIVGATYFAYPDGQIWFDFDTQECMFRYVQTLEAKSHP